MATEALTSDDLIRTLTPNLHQHSQQMHTALQLRDHKAFVRAYEDFCTVADGVGEALCMEAESAPCAQLSTPALVITFPAGSWAPCSEEQVLARLRSLPMYRERPGDNG